MLPIYRDGLMPAVVQNLNWMEANYCVVVKILYIQLHVSTLLRVIPYYCIALPHCV